MKRFLRRWLLADRELVPPAPPSAPPVPSSPRVAQLEERMDYLEQALNRLRGRVTGADAHKPKEVESHQDDAGPTNGAAAMLATASPPEDRWLALREAKERKRGVLPR